MKLAADKTTCIKDVFENPKDYDGKFARICGQVESVCAAKGCWMKLSYPGATDTLFIKFSCPVKGRLIPMEAAGHLAIVEGTFTATEKLGAWITGTRSASAAISAFSSSLKPVVPVT